MSLTVNAKTYTANSFEVDKVTYNGPLKTISVKDDMILQRAAPKPVPTSSGVARSASKLTRTLTLTGALEPTRDSIMDVNLSVPVGAVSTDIDAILNDMGAFIASATYKTFVKNQLINY